uniref:Probable glutamate--tRNA ligase, mitochondrial-like n=1 Tax=Saccoglossus kowalevskii TaxID=10224 RepID=A0ABM0M4B5_SACKO|nr:PREDICTED: probable glutamate--tRNA ligase, mitochondrial-like [Saccoglossus kowalevskii]
MPCMGLCHAWLVNNSLLHFNNLEWLTSVGKHLQFYRAFGWTPPIFAHLPLLLNKDGSKLSKRQNDITVEHFKVLGHQADAVLNLITFCGSGFENNRQIRSLSGMIKEFSVERVTQHSAVLDMDLLDYITQQQILNSCKDSVGMQRLAAELKHLVEDTYTDRVTDDVLAENYLQNIIQHRKHHINRLSDLTSAKNQFLWLSPDIKLEELHRFTQQPESVLRLLLEELQKLTTVEWQAEYLVAKLQYLCTKHQLIPFSKMMAMLRYSLTGAKEGPGVVDIMQMLTKEKTLERLNSLILQA